MFVDMEKQGLCAADIDDNMQGGCGVVIICLEGVNQGIND